MKVNAYEVATQDGTMVPFQDALRRVWGLPEAQRLHTLDKFDMRIESFKAKRSGIYEMEFSKRIRHDIGKLSGVAPIETIPLEEGETFGSFTAAIYDPQIGHLLVESGQTCVRGSAIGDYISVCSGVAGPGYGLNIVIKDGIDPDSIRGKDCRKIEVAINSKKLTAQDRASNQGILSSFFRMSDGLGGDRIKFEISCQRVKPKGNRPGKQGLTSALLMDLAGDICYAQDQS